jgi:hypothetical protein
MVAWEVETANAVTGSGADGSPRALRAAGLLARGWSAARREGRETIRVGTVSAATAERGPPMRRGPTLRAIGLESWRGAEPAARIADAGNLAGIGNGADDRITPHTAPSLTRIGLGAGIAVVTGRAVGQRRTEAIRAAGLALGAGDRRRTGGSLTGGASTEAGAAGGGGRTGAGFPVGQAAADLLARPIGDEAALTALGTAELLRVFASGFLARATLAGGDAGGAMGVLALPLAPLGLGMAVLVLGLMAVGLAALSDGLVGQQRGDGAGQGHTRQEREQPTAGATTRQGADDSVKGFRVHGQRPRYE